MRRNSPIEEPRVGIQLWTRWVNGPLTCVDFSPGKHWTVLGFDDGEVQLIDSQGKELWTAHTEVPIRHVRTIDAKNRVVALDEHSRLLLMDSHGAMHRTVRFKEYWTSFEVKSNGLVVWGWHAPPRRLDFSGKEEKELGIPKPWRVVRAIAKSDLYFVVHNQVALGVYNGEGHQEWLVNHPVAMDLSRERPSEIAASDTGNAVAVSCFDKGVYVYDLPARTLKHLELDAMADRVSVSGDGRWMLFADALGKLYLVNQEATIVWTRQLATKVFYCRLDQKGEQALVLEESGNLTCFEFTDSQRDRGDFLELRKYEQVNAAQELWVKPAPFYQGNWKGLLKLSDDGRYLLYGAQKDFAVFDAQGNSVWRKAFMVRREDGWIAQDGAWALLIGPDEVFWIDPRTGDENHLTFYDDGIQEIGVEPVQGGFLILHRSGAFSLYSGQGDLEWKRSLKQRVSKIRLNAEHRMAVFQGTGRTLYTLDLKNLKAGRVVLPEEIVRLRVNQSSIYAGDSAGACYGIEYSGQMRWTHSLGEPVEEIVPLNRGVAFRSRQGRVVLMQDDGVLLGEAQLHHRGSVLMQVGDELLEVTPEGDSIGCYSLLGKQRLWQQAFPKGIDALAAARDGNRLAVLSGLSLHLFSAMNLPELKSERSSYLEF